MKNYTNSFFYIIHIKFILGPLQCTHKYRMNRIYIYIVSTLF